MNEETVWLPSLLRSPSSELQGQERTGLADVLRGEQLSPCSPLPPFRLFLLSLPLSLLNSFSYVHLSEPEAEQKCPLGSRHTEGRVKLPFQVIQRRRVQDLRRMSRLSRQSTIVILQTIWEGYLSQARHGATPSSSQRGPAATWTSDNLDEGRRLSILSSFPQGL